MAQPPNPQIDPAKVFEQADCFYQALAVLCNVEPENTQLAVTIGEPVMVLGALTIELFFKCLICIETGVRPPRARSQGIIRHLGADYAGAHLKDMGRRYRHTPCNRMGSHRGGRWQENISRPAVSPIGRQQII
jgi:hypothetical protein